MQSSAKTVPATGAIRYSKPEHIDFAVVENMLRATAESTGEVC